MKTRWMLLGLAAAGAAGWGAGCFTKACTEIGCLANFTATVRRADGSFPTGNHRLEILADGASLTCTFTFSGSVPDSGVPLLAACSSGVTVSVTAAMVCTDVPVNGGIAQMCVVVPDEFEERIAFWGTPGQVQVSQFVDDVAILDVAVVPTYNEFRPNGEGCEPVCHQASISWTL